MGSCDTKRRSQFSSSLPVSDYNQPSPRSKFMNTSIDDLPDDALVEILYRLDCYKSVTQCKRVSKRWCNLMSRPSFIGGFVSLKSDKHSPVKHSLLHRSGVEFLGRLSSSTEPLTPLFERLMSCHGLKTKPVIRGSYNDLILCSASKFDQQGYYFICNPSTVQWVPLPPPPQVYKYTIVGFICDLPYYNCRSRCDQGGSIFKLNAEYRYRVVRFICPEDQGDTLLNEFKVQIFSSETGDWIETIVSSPTAFCFDFINASISYANKGMLYWGGHSTDGDEQDFLIGINPFTINCSNNTNLSSTSSSTNGGVIIDHNNCCFIALGSNEGLLFSPLGVYKGCMRLYEYDIETYDLYIADLDDEEIYRVRLDQRRVYTLNEEMISSCDAGVTILGFDPDDDDILYLVRSIRRKRDILIKCNIRTGTWSTVAENTQVFYQFDGLYTLAVPWWPTPVRMLAPHSPSLSPQFQGPCHSNLL